MIKTLIAEDHRIFNEGLKSLLQPNYDVVAQIFSGSEFFPAVQKYTPQLVLMDINLPIISGLDLGKDLKISFPNIKLVFLSMYKEILFVQKAKEIGADAYLLKDNGSNEILDVLGRVMKGEKCFDEKLLEPNKPNLHHDDFFVKQFSLSKREVEVIMLISQGYSTEQISKEIFVSFETVKSHRKNIFFKLGFSKVSELIHFAKEHGIG